MRKIININQNWLFYKNTTATGSKDGAEQISLPHTWNAIDGIDGGNDYFRGTCLYEKQFTREELTLGKLCYLEIRGANSSASVYLNGKSLPPTTVGTPPGGSTSPTTLRIITYFPSRLTTPPTITFIPRWPTLPFTAAFTAT